MLAVLLEKNYFDALVTPKNSFASIVRVSEVKYVLGSRMTRENRTTDNYTAIFFTPVFNNSRPFDNFGARNICRQANREIY